MGVNRALGVAYLSIQVVPTLEGHGKFGIKPDRFVEIRYGAVEVAFDLFNHLVGAQQE
jgi:hypothetical protein